MNLVIGKTYIIDKAFRGGSKVELQKIYGKIYCKVKSVDSDYQWDTRIGRLSEVEIQKEQ